MLCVFIFTGPDFLQQLLLLVIQVLSHGVLDLIQI